MDLSVVVVTYRSRAHIADCLRSLDRARGPLAMEVLVVDNASGDGTLDEVRTVAPWARIVETGDNLGYARAVNIGIRASTGACMMVRREAIDRVGGMDEAYFMFNEDVDWCHAMKDAGWSVDFVPAAQVTHHVGASRRKVADRVILERHRGMIHYFRKYHRAHPAVDAIVAAAVMLRARLMLAQNARRR